MPELPDVEGFREVLASCTRDRAITGVTVYDPGVLHGVSPGRLGRALSGHRLGEPRRHGKWLLAPVDAGGGAPSAGPTLLMHFGMTGRLLCRSGSDPLHPHDRIVLALGDDQLRYRDQRKLKGWWLTSDVGAVLGGQGPDAWEIDRAEFEEALGNRRGGVKSTLIDQSVLAGLGNLLADEILWRARLHPARRASELSPQERRRLHTDMRRVLRTAVPTGAVPPRASWLTGHRDDPEAECPRCGTSLERDRVAGRSTVWCPHCQPPGGTGSG
ncbi:Fpg/Nei family DNA glycosylase [Streptomyces sp. TP-A0874]|uniref:Fpg/Nei family DNA glycosylase n=1 Tax=Streptomyces sp. TP-A0874 TaxID=549819 RepID=UPI000853DE7B|nr:DNA-formamidopyrimidine glycosylase family protein [Streptomyces sp. TP-A0874]